MRTDQERSFNLNAAPPAVKPSVALVDGYKRELEGRSEIPNVETRTSDDVPALDLPCRLVGAGAANVSRGTPLRHASEKRALAPPPAARALDQAAFSRLGAPDHKHPDSICRCRRGRCVSHCGTTHVLLRDDDAIPPRRYPQSRAELRDGSSDAPLDGPARDEPRFSVAGALSFGAAGS
jgi:hypothetical protein